MGDIQAKRTYVRLELSAWTTTRNSPCMYELSSSMFQNLDIPEFQLLILKIWKINKLISEHGQVTFVRDIEKINFLKTGFLLWNQLPVGSGVHFSQGRRQILQEMKQFVSFAFRANRCVRLLTSLTSAVSEFIRLLRNFRFNNGCAKVFRHRQCLT